MLNRVQHQIAYIDECDAVRVPTIKLVVKTNSMFDEVKYNNYFDIQRHPTDFASTASVHLHLELKAIKNYNPYTKIFITLNY